MRRHRAAELVERLEPVQISVRAALGCKPACNAFERLPGLREVYEALEGECRHTRTRMRDALDEPLCFQPLERFAQRSAADAVGARQFRLGNLASRSYLTLDDGSLDQAEHVLGKRATIYLLRCRGDFNGIQHDCRQSPDRSGETTPEETRSQQESRMDCRHLY